MIDEANLECIAMMITYYTTTQMNKKNRVNQKVTFLCSPLCGKNNEN